MLQNKFKVAIGLEFLAAFSAIPKHEQTKVLDFVNKFRYDPTQPSLNYEKIQSAKDPKVRSVRVNLAYRAIVVKPDAGNVYMLVWVDHHDEAYAWAKNRLFEINPATGGLQIIDVEHSMVQKVETVAEQPGLFAGVADKHLIRFGVPEVQIPLVRSVRSDDQLDKLAGQVPEEAYEALYLLAAGASLEEVALELDRPEQPPVVDTADFVAALESPDTKRRFYVVDDDIELAAILQAPLEHWRVFLHPSQRKLVERDWNGPVRVLGGAGTGKTVAAMHRARWLAQQRLTGANDRILFTTFTRNLAADVSENMSKICPDEVMKRIEVVNLDRWVADFLKRSGYEYKVDFANAASDLWKQALQMADSSLKLDEGFYRDEWERIVQPQEIATLQDYLKAPRIGRGVQLSRKERQGVWPVFDEYRLLMNENRLREAVDAFRDARVLLENKGNVLPYRAIVVDEAQDFGPQAFRLMRQMVAAGPNDLFIVGDAHQRIYRHTVVLGKCGVNVRGRSKKLRINYRTTEETRRFAVGLLEGVRVDDLDEGVDGQKGYKSLMHGDAPQVRCYPTFREEVAGIVEHIGALEADGTPSSNICLVARTDDLLGQYEAALSKQGLATHRVSRTKAEDRSAPGVRLATMHRVKGLEFEQVIIAGVNDGVVPLPAGMNSIDPLLAAESEARERALVYVSATRARKGLVVTCHKTPSRFLPKG